MISSKKEYREYLNADRNAYQSTFIQERLLIVRKYMRRLRKAEYIHNCKCTSKGRLKLLGKIRSRWQQYLLYRLSVRSGLTIPINTFGKGLYIPHHGTIVVNRNVRFGEYCVVQCGVNVSENVQGGNHVYLGAGCKLMRNVVVGDDVIVGANAVVTKTVSDDNVVLVGMPAKIVSTNGYRNRTAV